MSQTKAQLLDNIKDNVQLDARNSLRFADTDSSHYVAFKAPATVSSNVTWTLPAADGSANYVLATDGSGTLSWIADPAGQWTTSGSNIYFTGGNVGIGDSSPSNPLSVTGASSFDGDITFTGANYNVTWDKSADDLIFNDNAKAVFGTSSDGVEIYHNGSASWIADTGTGGLNILSNLLWLGNAAGSETFIQGTENGEVSLWYDNGEKLNTVTDGVNITGSLQFADDTNTYLAHPSSDVLAVTAGGNEALSILAGGNVRINGTPAWTETGGDYGNLSIRGTTSSSSGFLNLGNGAAATNSEFDLARIKIHNGATEVARITGITGDGNNDSGELWFATKATGGSLTTALVIDKDRKVGIGTSSPSWDLQVSGSNTTIDIEATGWAQLRLTGGSSENYITSDDQLSFYVGGSERIIFKTSGQLLVGHDTVIGHNGVDGYLQVTGTGTDDSSINLNRFSADAWCPFLTFGKSRNATKGSHTIVQNNDYLAYINFAASDGVDFNNTAAYIAVKVDGTPGTDDTPGRIEFATCPDGTNAATTRTTIDNAGATLFSGLTGNTDTRNIQGIAVKSPAGLSFNAYGGNGSRNWRIRPDDLGGWADLDFSCAPTDTATDWPDASGDLVLSLQGDTKDVVVSNGNLKIGTAGKGIDFSATSNQAGVFTGGETLTDYEAGLYTPELLAHNGSAWATATLDAGTFYGSYVKIGNVVHVQVYGTNFHLNSAHDGQLAGFTLPITADAGNTGYSVLTTNHENCFASAGQTNLFVATNTNRALTIQEHSTSYNTWSGSSGRYIMFAGTYRSG